VPSNNKSGNDEGTNWPLLVSHLPDENEKKYHKPQYPGRHFIPRLPRHEKGVTVPLSRFEGERSDWDSDAFVIQCLERLNAVLLDASAMKH
jgi:hypothetical protein